MGWTKLIEMFYGPDRTNVQVQAVFWCARRDSNP